MVFDFVRSNDHAEQRTITTPTIQRRRRRRKSEEKLLIIQTVMRYNPYIIHDDQSIWSDRRHKVCRMLDWLTAFRLVAGEIFCGSMDGGHHYASFSFPNVGSRLCRMKLSLNTFLHLTLELTDNWHMLHMYTELLRCVCECVIRGRKPPSDISMVHGVA